MVWAAHHAWSRGLSFNFYSRRSRKNQSNREYFDRTLYNIEIRTGSDSLRRLIGGQRKRREIDIVDHHFTGIVAVNEALQLLKHPIQVSSRWFLVCRQYANLCQCCFYNICNLNSNGISRSGSGRNPRDPALSGALRLSHRQSACMYFRFGL